MIPFRDRAEAGRRLGEALQDFRGADVVVLGLPRGGVPVAFEVAEALGAPLDVIVVRKLGVPFQPELAMGAIGEDGVRIVDSEVVRVARVTEGEFAVVEERERAELTIQARRFRSHRPREPLTGRTALVVDDGIATGSTARAACHVAHAHGATRVVLAAPVAPRASVTELRREADEVVCLETPGRLRAVGEWYTEFSPTSDEHVVRLLEQASRAAEHAAATTTGPPRRDEEIVVRAGHTRLAGHLNLPERARGIVVFSNPSGSSRYSPRNRFVASVLNQAGLGTLLFDLLTGDEEFDRATVFDVELLARRLRAATGWLRTQPEVEHVRIGYLGASTGAGAALRAAAEPNADIAALVSLGGRPELAGPSLSAVRAPTLLIIGGHDDPALDLNRQAQGSLECENRLAVVPGATQLFEEPGALEAVAALARDWFVGHLAPAPQPAQ